MGEQGEQEMQGDELMSVLEGDDNYDATKSPYSAWARDWASAAARAACNAMYFVLYPLWCAVGQWHFFALLWVALASGPTWLSIAGNFFACETVFYLLWGSTLSVSQLAVLCL